MRFVRFFTLFLILVLTAGQVYARGSHRKHPFPPLPFSAKDTSKEAIIINGEIYAIDQVEQFYYSSNIVLFNTTRKGIDKLAQSNAGKKHQTLKRKNFISYFITRVLVFQKAKSDKSIDQKELRSVYVMNGLNGVALYYFNKTFGEKIKVTDSEVEQFYNENKNLFNGVALTDRVLERVRSEIYKKKFQLYAARLSRKFWKESSINTKGYEQYLQGHALR
jgi:hypothetical protein